MFLGKIKLILLSRKFRKIIITTSIVLFVFQIICGSIAYYCIFNTKIDWESFERKFSYLACFFSNPNVPVEKQQENTKNKDKKVDEIKKILDDAYAKETERIRSVHKWVKELSKNDIKQVKIKSFDNLNLNGTIIFNNSVENNKNWIIMVFGYGDNGYHMWNFDFIKPFYELGFNVLVIDQRAYGHSEGQYTSLGYKERLDVKNWILYLAKEYPECNIGTWGVSMGATTVLLACGEDLPDNFKFCIADCPFNSFYKLLKYLSGHTMGIPSLLSSYLLTGVDIVARFRHKTNIRFSTEDSLKKAKVPILFFHGDSDTYVPFNLSKGMYESYKNYKEIVITKYASHCLSMTLDYDNYVQSIKNFSRKFMDFSKFDELKNNENNILDDNYNKIKTREQK